MYDILVYLFENCQQADLAYDRERVAKKLSAAGFEDSDISEALHWLAGVHARAAGRAAADCPNRATHSAPSRRASSQSSTRSAAAFSSRSSNRAFSTPQTRELVIERALAASGDSLSLEQLKLVVLMVLWNQQTPTSRLLAEDLFSAQQARLPS